MEGLEAKESTEIQVILTAERSTSTADTVLLRVLSIKIEVL
jgi:hypothetical protein